MILREGPARTSWGNIRDWDNTLSYTNVKIEEVEKSNTQTKKKVNRKVLITLLISYLNSFVIAKSYHPWIGTCQNRCTIASNLPFSLLFTSILKTKFRLLYTEVRNANLHQLFSHQCAGNSLTHWEGKLEQKWIAWNHHVIVRDSFFLKLDQNWWSKCSLKIGQHNEAMNECANIKFRELNVFVVGRVSCFLSSHLTWWLTCPTRSITRSQKRIQGHESFNFFVIKSMNERLDAPVDHLFTKWGENFARRTMQS